MQFILNTTKYGRQNKTCMHYTWWTNFVEIDWHNPGQYHIVGNLYIFCFIKSVRNTITYILIYTWIYLNTIVCWNWKRLKASLIGLIEHRQWRLKYTNNCWWIMRTELTLKIMCWRVRTSAKHILLWIVSHLCHAARTTIRFSELIQFARFICTRWHTSNGNV